ncbi:MAG TPA: hydroxymethylbilane synthase [Methanospirillum sp.]|uniref:hydroxymethylbilane synthase n=1 Tax=Methanospirillum sp. TaxID=45200 RepID=UPI002C1C6CAF|nr:hydroxymethylbilane synthase [Methanospirillum sp.]HOJ95943.1 hydroxymethylbilane synthase [Methanospirillum sp.]HOL40845.1 hydroxymethylbilane synthase [Methanospirillum sp.]HPP77903.1 hydroxymethylbilane synthase [Methanospirillum sp.]
MPLRVGTRASQLARAQAEKVCSLLHDLGEETELVFISTAGDEQTGVPLHEIGGQGVFVRALDDALKQKRIDLAVHSMKDIPAARPAGLITAAILPRDSPCDFIVTDHDLTDITILGTSSTRRTAQCRRNLPWTAIKPLRGNVDTRLSKLRSGVYDGILLAKAGLERLSLNLSGYELDPHLHVPSPNQGTIAVVTRTDPEITDIISGLDDQKTRIDTMLERRVMEVIGGGCFTPLGIYCHDRLMIAEVLSLEGDRSFRRKRTLADIDDAVRFGQEVREKAGDLINEAYQRLGITHE